MHYLGRLGYSCAVSLREIAVSTSERVGCTGARVQISALRPIKTIAAKSSVRRGHRASGILWRQKHQLAGSPVTIPVSYSIGSGVDGDTVTPRVVAAGAAGTVILRGSGFTGATDVSFGSEAATSITVVSDSEIDASYPVLPAGTYPVTINSGSISDTASLVAASSPAFTATSITYPAGVGGQTMAYYHPSAVRVIAAWDATHKYVWGDRVLAFVRCANCGCMTHWESLDPNQCGRVGVNVRMFEDIDIAKIRIRHFEGAKSWSYID